MSARPIQIVTSATDKQGTTCHADFDALAASIETACTSVERPAKVDLPGFVPCRFGDTRNANGSLVHNANVQAVTVGALDYDRLTPAQYAKLLRDLEGTSAFVYSSPSDGLDPTVRKCRVVVELDRELTPAECAQWRDGMARVLDVGPADERTFSAHTVFFFGRLAGSPPRDFHRFRGSPVPSANVLAAAPPRVEREPEPAPQVTGDDALPDARAEELGEWIAERMIAGSKHRLMFELGGWCAQREWSESDVERLAEAVLTTRQATHGDVRDVRAGIKAALDGHGGHSVHGWHSLAELLDGGELAANELDASAPNPWRERRDAEARAIETLFTEPVPAPAIAPHHDAPDPWQGFAVVSADADDAPLVRLIDGLDIVPGYTTALIARASESKSPTSLSMALALAGGLPWLGRMTRRCTVLYLAHEKTRDLNRKRKRIANSMGVDPATVHMLDMRRFALNDVDWRRGKTSEVPTRIAQLVRTMVGAGLPVVVFLDTYGAAVSGVPSNENAYGEPLKLLSDLLTTAGAAFVPLIHVNKGVKDKPTLFDAGGHGALGQIVSGAIGLWRPDKAKAYEFELFCARPIEDDTASVGVRWTNDARGDNEQWGLRFEEFELPNTREDGKPVRLSAADRVREAEARVRMFATSSESEAVRRKGPEPLREAVKRVQAANVDEAEKILWRMARHGAIVMTDTPDDLGAQEVTQQAARKRDVKVHVWWGTDEQLRAWAGAKRDARIANVRPPPTVASVALATWAETRDEFTAADARCVVPHLSDAALGRELQALGFDAQRVRVNGERETVYRRRTVDFV